MHSIFTDMKITFSDVAFSTFGIFYFVLFTSFIPKIYALEVGKILIWYLILVSWGSDIVAYLIGRNFGKHKFSKVSPNKTIEGCTAGVVGAVVLSLIYTYLINTYSDIYINYIVIGWVSAVLCIIGQLGDFAASVIKRHLEVKDYSNIFPGHGGMVDRLDSVIAIAPFAYILFTILI
jgi:phosphatidate cytidylyltransferase